MERKFSRIVSTGIALSVGAVIMIPAPAFAEDGIYQVTNNVSYDGSTFEHRKETRSQFRWSNQSDGTGVKAEFLDVDTIEGADRINGYTNVRARWIDDGSGYVRRTWNWGDEPDNFTKNHDSVYGIDVGPMRYHLDMCGGNDHLWWRWRVHNGGESHLIDKGHAQDSYCGAGGGD